MSEDAGLMDVHVAFDNGTEQDFIVMAELDPLVGEAAISAYENELALASVRPNHGVLLRLPQGGSVSIPSDKILWVRARVRRTSPHM